MEWIAQIRKDTATDAILCRCWAGANQLNEVTA